MTRRALQHSLRLGAAVSFAAMTASRAFAHGDDQLLFDALTEEIAKAPEADLFIRRGELYRHHEEWAKAEADFAAAAKLEPQLPMVDFFRARLWLEAGEPAKALPFADGYVANAAMEAEAWLLRGDILAALGKPEEGAAAYDEGIRRAPNPRPEHFIRRAKFLAAMPNADALRVLAALDEGIKRVGPLLSLIDYAVTLELERKNYDGAIARIDAALERASRREVWLVRRGDILAQAGRDAEAISDYRAALAAIEQLPAVTRQTAPVEKLERDARTGIERLSRSAP